MPLLPLCREMQCAANPFLPLSGAFVFSSINKISQHYQMASIAEIIPYYQPMLAKTNAIAILRK
jgi:hypothetical protein